MKILELLEAKQSGARPAELGDAYFYIHHKLVDITPERNHRDWLVKHQHQLGLPDYIQNKPVRALWEAYKQGILRIVWDKGAKWRTGVGHGQGNVLYINGFDQDVWGNMKSILNQPKWAGMIDTVVIEYVQDAGGKPNWYKTDIFKGGDIESLYRGKKPRRQRLPANATYGGEPGIEMVKEINHSMNHLNDTEQNVMEMFNAHIMGSGFWDQFRTTPKNGFHTWPGHNYDAYMGMLENKIS
jgi:hypothetical protein